MRKGRTHGTQTVRRRLVLLGMQPLQVQVEHQQQRPPMSTSTSTSTILTWTTTMQLVQQRFTRQAQLAVAVIVCLPVGCPTKTRLMGALAAAEQWQQLMQHLLSLLIRKTTSTWIWILWLKQRRSKVQVQVRVHAMAELLPQVGV